MTAEQAIKEITKENVTTYPKDWLCDHREMIENYSALLWGNRGEHEVERDKDLGVAEGDYKKWVEEAFNEMKSEVDAFDYWIEGMDSLDEEEYYEFENDKLFVLRERNGELHEMTHKEVLQEFFSDETTSPRGIEPRVHTVRKYMTADGLVHDHEDEADEWIAEMGLKDEVREVFQLRTWGAGGQNPKILIREYMEEMKAELEVLRVWHGNMINDSSDVAIFESREEAMKEF